MNAWSRLRRSGVVLEDAAILALNKPAGVAVMGERHETDIVELAQGAGERLYPVHRIDKVTSGVVLLAKDLGCHGDLTRQFNKRSVDKFYFAITRSTGLPRSGVIDLPLSVGRKSRIRIAAPRECITLDKVAGRWSVPPSEVLDNTTTYPSVTAFAKVWDDDRRTLLLVRPITGRRHQIRVHLAWIGHEIEGDPLFDRAGAARGERTCLHSWRLGVDAAWLGGKRIEIEAPPGEDFWATLRDHLPDRCPSGMLRIARRLAADLTKGGEGRRSPL